MRGVWSPVAMASCCAVMKSVSNSVQAIATPIAISTCERRRDDVAAAFMVTMCVQLNARGRIGIFLRVGGQILRLAPDSLPGSTHRHSVAYTSHDRACT